MLDGMMPYLVALDSASDTIADNIKRTGSCDNWQDICESFGLFNLSNSEIDYIRGRVDSIVY